MKYIFIFALLSSALMAASFDVFLDMAIEKSPYLKASELKIKQTSFKGETLTRYKNPNLDLELSFFDQDNSSSELGFRTSYSQDIRLWGVSSDKDSLVKANIELAKSNYIKNKAKFIRDISLSFTNYSLSKLLEDLALDELELAKKIFDISKSRYNLGSISKGEFLQAKVDYKMVKSRVETLKIISMKNYYSLLKQSGINDEVVLDINYDFSIKDTNSSSPELIELKNQTKSFIAESKVNSNKVEWMNLAAEYENEPDQDIYRVSATLPLAFFNDKSQEKAISTLESKKSQMLSENLQAQIDIELKRLSLEIDSLERLKLLDLEILKDEKELLTMFEDAYKIANVNLIALQDAKGRLIETQERLIKTKIQVDRDSILMNYLKGNYND